VVATLSTVSSRSSNNNAGAGEIRGEGRGEVVKGAVFVAGDAFEAVAFLTTSNTAMTLSVGGYNPDLRIRSIRQYSARFRRQLTLEDAVGSYAC
jgi:hypothetical protein